MYYAWIWPESSWTPHPLFALLSCRVCPYWSKVDAHKKGNKIQVPEAQHKVGNQFISVQKPKKWAVYALYTTLYTVIQVECSKYVAKTQIQVARVQVGCGRLVYNPIYTKMGRNTCCIQQYTFDVYTDFKCEKGRRKWAKPKSFCSIHQVRWAKPII